MTQPIKKFTFGFSKVTKKSNLVLPPPLSAGKSDGVQFIDCIEEKAIKLRKGEEEDEKGPLVIPLVGPAKSSTLIKGKSIAELVEDFSETQESKPESQQNALQDFRSDTSLDAMAIKEILQEATDVKVQETTSLGALPSVDNVDSDLLQRESTLEDYENVPVSQFGLAMLRGMGWKPGDGIGKNSQLIPVTLPAVRPKGLGLGADKVVHSNVSSSGTSSDKKDEEDLKIVKGACIKVLSGSYRGQYAMVEGFTDDSGRVIVKLAIGGHTVSLSEASIYPVSKVEYKNFSKVLNADKFGEYQKKEAKDDTSPKAPSNVSQEASKPNASHRSTSPQGGSQVSKKGYAGSKSSISCQVSHVKKERNSESPERKKERDNIQSHRERSRSPYQSRKDDWRERRSDKYKSGSILPARGNRSCTSSVASDSIYRSSSHSNSKAKDACLSDSDSRHHDSKSKKKKNKDSVRKHGYSSSDSGDDSPHQSSRKKKKGKKSRRSHSRSPRRRR